APLALSAGARQLSEPGLLDTNSLTFTGLTRGQTYYWSVQAIDSSLVGSAFAAEGSFLAECLPTSEGTTFFLQADQPGALFFPFQDLDFDPFQGVEITTLPDFGVLTLNGVPVTAGQEVSFASLSDGDLVYRGTDDGTERFTQTSFDFRVKSNNFF